MDKAARLSRDVRLGQTFGKGERRLDGGDILSRMPGDCASRRGRPCYRRDSPQGCLRNRRGLLDLPAAKQSFSLLPTAAGRSLEESPAVFWMAAEGGTGGDGVDS